MSDVTRHPGSSHSGKGGAGGGAGPRRPRESEGPARAVSCVMATREKRASRMRKLSVVTNVPDRRSAANAQAHWVEPRRPWGPGGVAPSICVSGFGGPLAEAARKRGADKGPGSQRARPRAGKKKSVKSLRRRRKRYRPVTRRRPGEERPRFLSCAAIKVASLKIAF